MAKVKVMVFNITFTNISVTMYIVVVCFIGGGKQINEESHQSVASH
jgi:hypothetical protein